MSSLCVYEIFIYFILNILYKAKTIQHLIKAMLTGLKCMTLFHTRYEGEMKGHWDIPSTKCNGVEQLCHSELVSSRSLNLFGL